MSLKTKRILALILPVIAFLSFYIVAKYIDILSGTILLALLTIIGIFFALTARKWYITLISLIICIGNVYLIVMLLVALGVIH